MPGGADDEEGSTLGVGRERGCLLGERGKWDAARTRDVAHDVLVSLPHVDGERPLGVGGGELGKGGLGGGTATEHRGTPWIRVGVSGEQNEHRSSPSGKQADVTDVIPQGASLAWHTEAPERYPPTYR